MPEGSHGAIRRLLITTCLVATGIAYALSGLPVVEAQAVGDHPRVSIDLGQVTVWLGMSQEDALAQFRGAGYKVLGDSATAGASVQDGNHVYSVWFKGGKVICAEREWYSSGRDEMDAVLGALAAMASHGGSSCSVMHDTSKEPDHSAERILIECGRRSVLLMKGKIDVTKELDPSQQMKLVDVFERIGQIP